MAYIYTIVHKIKPKMKLSNSVKDFKINLQFIKPLKLCLQYKQGMLQTLKEMYK